MRKLLYFFSLCLLFLVTSLLILSHFQTFYHLHCYGPIPDAYTVGLWHRCYKKRNFCTSLGVKIFMNPFKMHTEAEIYGRTYQLNSVYDVNEFSSNDISKGFSIVALFGCIPCVLYAAIFGIILRNKCSSVQPIIFSILIAVEIALTFSACVADLFWLENRYRKYYHCHYSWGFFFVWGSLFLEIFVLAPISVCMAVKYHPTEEEEEEFGLNFEIETDRITSL